MRARHWVAGGAASMLLAVSVLASGCFDNASVCELTFSCPPNGGGTGGGADTDSGPPPACLPSESGTVSNDCGIFVSSSKGADDQVGSKEAPVQTLAKALELLVPGQSIYACAEAFSGPIEMPAGTEIFGGLDCAGMWSLTDGKTQVTGQAGEIPVRLLDGSGTTQLQNLHVQAADAVAAGGSSIAVLVDGVGASFVNCKLEAGNGANGEAGMSIPTPAMGGTDGTAGEQACSAAQVTGPEGPITQCGTVDTNGGQGGPGTSASGGNGTPGFPGTTANGGAGSGPNGTCMPGGDGAVGAAGDPGLDATGFGSIDASGYVGVLGGEGKPGQPGQGGGGGGGSKGGTVACTAKPGSGGASGGSGASGGCGGAGGKGGGYGGSSIALVSVNGAELSFSDVELVAKNGGKRGEGGLGQEGGGGGAMGGAGGGVPAGVSLAPGCGGGKGGKGGQGGAGGRGLGGHSLGIAYAQSAAPPGEGVMIQVGDAGEGAIAMPTLEFK
jgi:hypothetical protein